MVAKEPTKESAKETVKTIARGKPVVTGEPVAKTRVLSTIAHGAAGASGTRLSLRPLFFRGTTFLQDSGATRREDANVCLSSLRAKASNPWLLVCGSMDCFAEGSQRRS
jgi:hypothetical protein